MHVVFLHLRALGLFWSLSDRAYSFETIFFYGLELFQCVRTERIYVKILNYLHSMKNKVILYDFVKYLRCWLKIKVSFRKNLTCKDINKIKIFPRNIIKRSFPII